MARISRREAARRAAIRQGLRRYWRQVRQVARRERIAIRPARGLVREIRQIQEREAISFRAAFVAFRVEHPIQAIQLPETEVAFNLDDVDRRLGLNLFERLRDRTEIRTTVQFEFPDRLSPKPQDREVEITFAPGSSREEFFSHYFEALREAHDAVYEQEGLTGETSGDFGIFVSTLL